MERKAKFTSWIREVTTTEWKDKSTVNQNRPEWDQRLSVKKGDVGERIFKHLFEKRGWIMYKCLTRNSPHVIDFIAYKNNKAVRFLEVKAKKSMTNKRGVEHTGVNTSNLKTYKYFLEKHKQDIFLVFVDQAKGEIYGNYLSKLIETKVEENVKFPYTFIAKDGTSITTFPVSSMKRIAKLDERQIKELIRYTKGEDKPHNELTRTNNEKKENN